MWAISLRRVVTCTLGCAAGAALFFWMFTAMFTGVWQWLIVFVLGYGAVGALGVLLGRVRPSEIATAVILPAAPWLLWMIPSLVMESRPLAALAWPVVVTVLWGIAWVGGYVVISARRPPYARPDGPNGASPLF